jgi:hypothetical protein
MEDTPARQTAAADILRRADEKVPAPSKVLATVRYLH